MSKDNLEKRFSFIFGSTDNSLKTSTPVRKSGDRKSTSACEFSDSLKNSLCEVINKNLLVPEMTPTPTVHDISNELARLGQEILKLQGANQTLKAEESI